MGMCEKMNQRGHIFKKAVEGGLGGGGGRVRVKITETKKAAKPTQQRKIPPRHNY